MYDKVFAEFDRVFVTENLWKSDDEFTANVPIDNIKSFIRDNFIPKEVVREEIRKTARTIFSGRNFYEKWNTKEDFISDLSRALGLME